MVSLTGNLASVGYVVKILNHDHEVFTTTDHKDHHLIIYDQICSVCSWSGQFFNVLGSVQSRHKMLKAIYLVFNQYYKPSIKITYNSRVAMTRKLPIVRFLVIIYGSRLFTGLSTA